MEAGQLTPLPGPTAWALRHHQDLTQDVTPQELQVLLSHVCLIWLYKMEHYPLYCPHSFLHLRFPGLPITRGGNRARQPMCARFKCHMCCCFVCADTLVGNGGGGDARAVRRHGAHLRLAGHPGGRRAARAGVPRRGPHAQPPGGQGARRHDTAVQGVLRGARAGGWVTDTCRRRRAGSAVTCARARIQRTQTGTLL